MSAEPRGGMQTVFMRNFFYRDSVRLLIVGIVISMIVNVGQLGIIYGLIVTQPKPTYFASTADGRILPLTPLSQPMLTPSVLLQWTTQTATSAYTYDFRHFKSQMELARQNFTPEGWASFDAALQASGNLAAVESKRMLVTSYQRGGAVVTNEGLDPATGRYFWNVEFPMEIVYEGSGTSRYEQRLIAQIVVVRVPTIEYERGLAIHQFITKSGGG